jgi:dCMP deaminase
MTNTTFDWSELAFGSKKPLKELDAIFIAAPREVSVTRFKQLVQTYLPKGNIVLGIAKESYIQGFEDQPQFRTLRQDDVQTIIDKVNTASKKHQIYVLSYFQRDFAHIIEKIPLKHVALINGSWKYSFHTLPQYYILANQRTSFELISPFASEQEAHDYEARVMPEIEANHPFQPGIYDEQEMMAKAGEVAQYSFDYAFQTGVALGKPNGDKYDLLAWSYNSVVPFQTYAMHNGASRETHFSPPHDLNHYDAVHAEVELIVAAGKKGLDLTGTTMFINLLPCPNCARMFVETDISEFVYTEDHSNGYAVHMLEAAGKKVRRLV